MSERVPRRLRSSVQIRANWCCEYCHLPEQLSSHIHEVDHIIPVRHTGHTELDNLAYACLECNRYRGPNIASIDPLSGALTALFNPRKQVWQTHFRWEDAKIVPLMPEGRVTVNILQMNQSLRVEERQDYMDAEVYFVS